MAERLGAGAIFILANGCRQIVAIASGRDAVTKCLLLGSGWALKQTGDGRNRRAERTINGWLWRTSRFAISNCRIRNLYGLEFRRAFGDQIRTFPFYVVKIRPTLYKMYGVPVGNEQCFHSYDPPNHVQHRS